MADFSRMLLCKNKMLYHLLQIHWDMEWPFFRCVEIAKTMLIIFYNIQILAMSVFHNIVGTKAAELFYLFCDYHFMKMNFNQQEYAFDMN